MKKAIIIISALLITLSAKGQDYERAVGARLGTSIGASYKQFVTAGSAFEVVTSLDLIGKNDRKLTLSAYGEYHYNLGVDGLSLFGGPGVSYGLYVAGDYRDGAVFSIDLISGVEYKLPDYPFILSFDWNPQLQMVTNAGIKPANFGLSFRYTF
ncbi:hypothetical protein BRDCF_p1336 [Bacteroidales bacterium CF]|jgi:hypothetical protein|nr:hypothetical protein BRDCF_p1336 [Bacteroidales bacterium CF]NCB97189.1 hypothetical protein [Bacteroidia bacterium]